MAALQNEIYVGSLTNPDYYFTNENILGGMTVQQAISVVGEELTIDTFEPIVSDYSVNVTDVIHFRSSDGEEIQTNDSSIFAISANTDYTASSIILIPDGTPVWYYTEGVLIGKFFISSVYRLANNKYQLNCVSAIGRLDRMTHSGGLYHSETFGDMLGYILAENPDGTGSPAIDYNVDSDVASLVVSGWLPYASKRDNLHQLVFAYGVNIIKDTDGNPRFTFIRGNENAPTIPDAQIYNLGDMEYEKPYSNITIVEHTFLSLTDESPVILFDNSAGTTAVMEEVLFSEAPIIVSTLTTTELLTIVEANENYAIVSGNGTLTGVPYTHTERNVSRSNPAGDSEKTVKVSDCTLVNLINSENLLNRLYAFYCPADFIKKINNSIIYTDQRCGKSYHMTSPFRETENVFLASMAINTTSFNRADCTWYADYTPAGQEGLYHGDDIVVPEPDPEDPEQEITTGDWEVPQGVESFRVVLIGGGTGGSSGWPGKNGKDTFTYTNVGGTEDIFSYAYGAEGGEGGAGGEGGSPGRVKIIDVTNAVPGTTYHFSLGIGGAGGAPSGFIPDTIAELRAALTAENPGTEYTDAELQDMIDNENTNWNGSPNAGTAGTATTFGEWSTADSDAYVPTGGIYDPFTDTYFALRGNTGTRGGTGGARKVTSGSSFAWVTDGENVQTPDGTVYRGGLTGETITEIPGLPEAVLEAYGGNGAGAAVGIDRDSHPHINGLSNQEFEWSITEDDGTYDNQ